MTSLNTEEKKLLNSVENEEWKSIDNVSEEIQRYQTYAASQLSQNEIKVTLSDEDLAKIQTLSNQLGQSISDLTKDIIHSYLQKM
ncbi:hypothetical protein [Crocosphaera sp.]|uniref:hypothetical protein n=1 Tax=Crocosphaera sp. TaxID=2729996 RepID=UPI003F227EC0|nr:hypothetical protein [Crocosphaera sp.]